MGTELAFLAAIVESSDDAIIGITTGGRIASWNRGASTIYGYTAGEVIGRPIAILALPERQDEIALLLARLQRGERVRHFRTLHLAKSGQIINVSLSVSPIIDITGRLLGASAIARDITERLQAEESLREAEERYRLIFSAETDAILLVDATTGQLVDGNDSAGKLYGYPHDELSRLTLPDLCTDCQSWDPVAWLDPSDKSGRQTISVHRRRDGSTFTAEMLLSPFVWGKRSMLVGIVRDITERLHSQQLSHSLAMAREIQQYLLPRKTPAIPGLDIHAQNISCEEIGGDYYDFFALAGTPEPWIGFAVGDVSGHGIGAALLMATARGMLHSEVHNHGTDLTGMLAGMNRHLLAAIEPSCFMTLFFAWFDPMRSILHWISAGHGPVLWYKSGPGEIRELLPTATPLGIISAEAFAPAPPISLEAGDILLIGTDGIWEARNPQGQMFETGRLRQLLATWAPKNARQIHEAIMTRVHDFMAEEHPTDDMTLMIIKIVA